MSRSYKAFAAALGANLIFGSSYTAVKYITPQYIHPFALNFVRVAVTLVLFWILFILKPGKVKFERKDLLYLENCNIKTYSFFGWSDCDKQIIKNNSK